MAHVARSLLFVPGNRPERFGKASASGAHEVVLDLEDAVAPADKSAARDAVAMWLDATRRATVRINAAQTEWFDDDLRLIQSIPTAAVMLAKADADSLARTVDALPGHTIIALLETVRGYMDVRAMAAMQGLERIAFGSVDFAAETGISDEGEALTPVRIQIVLESCHAGLAAPVDGVSLNFNDPERMRDDARRSRKLGFGGKLCIHPAQVGAVNAAFLPSAEEMQWAERVVAAFTASGGAATSVDGKMIDKPVVDHARRVIAEFTEARLA
jgi:citrate lyase subunit beta/citryl-CoA lyase